MTAFKRELCCLQLPRKAWKQGFSESLIIPVRRTNERTPAAEFQMLISWICISVQSRIRCAAFNIKYIPLSQGDVLQGETPPLDSIRPDEITQPTMGTGALKPRDADTGKSFPPGGGGQKLTRFHCTGYQSAGPIYRRPFARTQTHHWSRLAAGGGVPSRHEDTWGRGRKRRWPGEG